MQYNVLIRKPLGTTTLFSKKPDGIREIVLTFFFEFPILKIGILTYIKWWYGITCILYFMIEEMFLSTLIVDEYLKIAIELTSILTLYLYTHSSSFLLVFYFYFRSLRNTSLTAVSANIFDATTNLNWLYVLSKCVCPLIVLYTLKIIISSEYSPGLLDRLNCDIQVY